MINNIKNNTISKADAKKEINELNKIKNVEKCNNSNDNGSDSNNKNENVKFEWECK